MLGALRPAVCNVRTTRPLILRKCRQRREDYKFAKIKKAWLWPPAAAARPEPTMSPQPEQDHQGASAPAESRILGRLATQSIDAVVVIDGAGIVRYANPAIEALSGHPPVDLIGHSLNRLLPDDVADLHDAHIRRYLADPSQSTVLGRVREMALKHRSGELVPIELKAVDLGVDQGERYFGSFMTDLLPPP